MKVRKSIKFSLLVILCSVLLACDFIAIEAQDIEIKIYDDFKKNNKLVEDLTYYDPRFIISNIPSFKNEMGQFISLGYTIRPSDGRHLYRVTYNLENNLVSKNLNSLKKDFENYIQKLASAHAKNLTLFKVLKQISENKIRDMWDGSVGPIWDEGSSVLKTTTTRGDMVKTIKTYKEKYSLIEDIIYVRSQHHLAFADFPESISSIFMVEFEDETPAEVRIHLQKEDKNWSLMGVNFIPISNKVVK